MICWSVKRRTHAYVDRKLGSFERAWIERHLGVCESCSANCEQISSIRLALHRLPQRPVPAQLAVRLRIAASRERQLLLETDGSRWRAVWRRWKFRLDGFMRPLTIPATGGLISSVALFGALAFTIGNIGSNALPPGNEVPILTIAENDPTLVPLELRSAVVLTMSVDSGGHIAGYAVRDGSSSFVGTAATSRDSSISIPNFPSVFAAAEPITRDISISFTPIVFRQ